MSENRIYIGHSLGQYSALVASGMIKFEDAVKLVVYFKCLLCFSQHDRGKIAKRLALESKQKYKVVAILFDWLEQINVAHFENIIQFTIQNSLDSLLRWSEVISINSLNQVIPFTFIIGD